LVTERVAGILPSMITGLVVGGFSHGADRLQHQLGAVLTTVIIALVIAGLAAGSRHTPGAVVDDAGLDLDQVTRDRTVG